MARSRKDTVTQTLFLPSEPFLSLGLWWVQRWPRVCCLGMGQGCRGRITLNCTVIHLILSKDLKHFQSPFYDWLPFVYIKESLLMWKMLASSIFNYNESLTSWHGHFWTHPRSQLPLPSLSGLFPIAPSLMLTNLEPCNKYFFFFAFYGKNMQKTEVSAEMKKAFSCPSKFGGKRSMFTENSDQGITWKVWGKWAKTKCHWYVVEWDYFQSGSHWLREDFVKSIEAAILG